MDLSHDLRSRNLFSYEPLQILIYGELLQVLCVIKKHEIQAMAKLHRDICHHMA